MLEKTEPVVDPVEVVDVEARASIAGDSAIHASEVQAIRGSRNPQVDGIAALVKSRIRPELDETLQDELAELLGLLPELASPKYQNLVPLADVVAAGLLTDKPNLKLARGIRQNLERRIMRSSSPFKTTRVILGLTAALGSVLYFALLFLFLGPRFFVPEKLLGLESSLVILVGIAGALGSIVSIMVRIQDFGSAGDVDQWVLFFTGFFKPVIGISFALFVFVLLSAGILPIKIDPEKSTYFFAALGFVSGFSERFAKDVATRTEDFIKTSQPVL